MQLMSESFIPASSVADFARKAVETLSNSPYPDYIKRDYYFKLAGNGLKFYVIFHIDEGHEEEALQDILNRVFQFRISIKGMEGTIEPVLSIEQVFSFLGQMDAFDQAPMPS